MYTAEWGTISSRKLELFNDDRSIYLRQVWGYGKTNKEIFIQIMKRERNDAHDEVLDETHAYTFIADDPNIGNISDGFMTDRMKNTAFVPASAVEKLTNGDF